MRQFNVEQVLPISFLALSFTSNFIYALVKLVYSNTTTQGFSKTMAVTDISVLNTVDFEI